MSVYDFEVQTVNGEAQPLSDYEGKVLLIVNTASRCGFTPQYEGLQSLYEKYHESGFEILGFPCNQFGHQEPGNNDEIQQFCDRAYNVSFPVFAKIEVNGPNTIPLYRYLKAKGKGLLGTHSIKWNFTKFLVDRKGSVVTRFAPNVEPNALEAPIQRELEK